MLLFVLFSMLRRKCSLYPRKIMDHSSLLKYYCSVLLVNSIHNSSIQNYSNQIVSKSIISSPQMSLLEAFLLWLVNFFYFSLEKQNYLPFIIVIIIPSPFVFLFQINTFCSYQCYLIFKCL